MHFEKERDTVRCPQTRCTRRIAIGICRGIETNVDELRFPFALHRFMRYKIQLINLLAYLLCTHITMCVCMDGPARVSVMYLYMILHT